MKKLILSLICLVFLTNAPHVYAQSVNADDITGVWLTKDKKARVEIYKEENQTYSGKIIWLRDPIDTTTGKPKVDKNNPEDELKTRPLLGLKMLHDFVFDTDEWEDGNIYDPNKGSTYSSYMQLVNIDSLRLRGYIGFSFIGRTSYWTRVE
jgi:uncharacterized protein (DUF2147 family)